LFSRFGLDNLSRFFVGLLVLPLFLLILFVFLLAFLFGCGYDFLGLLLVLLIFVVLLVLLGLLQQVPMLSHFLLVFGHEFLELGLFELFSLPGLPELNLLVLLLLIEHHVEHTFHIGLTGFVTCLVQDLEKRPSVLVADLVARAQQVLQESTESQCTKLRLISTCHYGGKCWRYVKSVCCSVSVSASR
jgi:hypothetical protein